MARSIKRPLSPQPVLASSLNLAVSRQKSGISLEQIAETTKISIRFLRAIENEEFEKLPGGIFNTSYLRQYAVATGLEVAELLAHYDRRMNPQPTPTDRSEPSDRSFFDRWFRVPAQAPRH